VQPKKVTRVLFRVKVPIDRWLTGRSRACSRPACLFGSTSADRAMAWHRRYTSDTWSATYVRLRRGWFVRVLARRIHRTPLRSATFPGRRLSRWYPRDRRDCDRRRRCRTHHRRSCPRLPSAYTTKQQNPDLVRKHDPNSIHKHAVNSVRMSKTH